MSDLPVCHCDQLFESALVVFEFIVLRHAFLGCEPSLLSLLIQHFDILGSLLFALVWHWQCVSVLARVNFVTTVSLSVDLCTLLILLLSNVHT